MSSVFLCLLCFSSLLILSSSTTTTTTTTTTLSLSPILIPNPTSNSWDFITHIAKSTLLRAHHLKNTSSVLHGTEKTPLYARSYGGYSVSLSFGTPPQKIPLVFDTGSSLLWVPCTSSYSCANCTFSGMDPTKIPTFKPKLSSTAGILGCQSPKCGWLYGPDVRARCSGCGLNLSNCSEACPSYLLQYGLGATSGLLILDNLDFSAHTVPGFLLGCSVLSSRQPEGIAGFGRAPTSLPNQLKLKKFSYCLLSHNFDDKPKSSDLVLTGAGKCAGAGEVSGVRYTPFHKNPVNPPYDEYYYVDIRRITVGGKRVKLPYKFLVPGPNGNGGAIVDSGSTFTFMDRALYDPIVAALAAQTRHLKRARDIEAQSGFGLCYDVSGVSERNVSFPKLALHFKGGARMDLPVANYFSFMSDLGLLCLTIVSDSSPAGPSGPVGPVMILGNYQQQNFYIEYDLENQRFGFKKKKCG